VPLGGSALRAPDFGHVSPMTDDEAAAGVAYDIHDAPSLDTTTEHDGDAERDNEQDTMRLRRFRRMRAMSVEPMS
jgi:hypothetical protein